MSAQKKQARAKIRLPYQTVFDAYQHPIYLLDEQLRFLYANEAYLTKIGASNPLDLLGKDFKTFYGSRDIKAFSDHAKRVFDTGEPSLFEYIKDRQNQFFLRSLTPVTSAPGERPSAVAVLSIDITGYKQTEQALEESEQLFRTVFSEIPVGIILVKEMRFFEVNPAFCNMLGYSESELKRLNVEDIAHPDDLEETKNQLETGFDQTMLPFQKQKKYLHKDGSVVWGKVMVRFLPSNDGKDPVLLVIVEDITEQKRAQLIQTVLFNISEATNLSENLITLLETIQKELGKLIDTTNFYVALFDEKTGTYSFPFMVDELDEFDAFTQTDLKKSLTDYVRRTGIPLLADEHTFQALLKQGEVTLIGAPSPIWMGVPLITAQKSIGVVVVQSYRDSALYSENDLEVLTFISEHIAMAIARKKAEEAVRASLREKEVLLKEIHHRVKNNLQIIQSLLGLQNDQAMSNENLNILKESQQRVRTIALVHDYLYRSPDLACIDLAEYIKDLAFGLFNIYKIDPDEIQLDLEIDNIDLPVDKAVPCGLIINELLTNAFKHAFPEPRSKQGKIAIRMKDKNDHIEWRVEDNGIGLPGNINMNQSETLGLRLVNILCTQQLNGELNLNRNKGTSFVFKFVL